VHSHRGWPRHFSARRGATSHAVSENVSGLRSNKMCSGGFDVSCGYVARAATGGRRAGPSCGCATRTDFAAKPSPSTPPSPPNRPGHPRRSRSVRGTRGPVSRGSRPKAINCRPFGTQKNLARFRRIRQGLPENPDRPYTTTGVTIEQPAATMRLATIGCLRVRL